MEDVQVPPRERKSNDIVSFQAGKMNRDATTNKVTADGRRGTCVFSRGDVAEGSASKEHYILKWIEKDSKSAENSYILFPRTHELKILQGSSKDGEKKQGSVVVGLYKRETIGATAKPAPPLGIFWLQEDSVQFDAKISSINGFLHSSEPCGDSASEDDTTKIRTLLRKRTQEMEAHTSKRPHLPPLREILDHPDTLKLLEESIKEYCESVEDKVPAEMRSRVPPSQLEKSELIQLFQSYTKNREVRECEALLQECLDLSVRPDYVIKELLGIDNPEARAENEYKDFLSQPSAFTLFKFLIAAEKEPGESQKAEESV